MSMKLCAAAVAALTIGAGAATAAPVNFTGTNANNNHEFVLHSSGHELARNVNISVDGNERGVTAGAFAVTLGDRDFVAFCVDLAQSFGLDSPFTRDDGLFSDGIIADLNALYTNSFDIDGWLADTKDNAKNAAAGFQIAIWEIITDFGSTYNLADGSFVATQYGTQGGSLAAIDKASDFLDSLGSASDDQRVAFFKNPDYQDLVIGYQDGDGTLGTVPLPAGGLLLLAGLGALAAASRRKV